MIPSLRPSKQMNSKPTNQPSLQPADVPSSQPGRYPTCQPSKQPLRQPTEQPTKLPFMRPTKQPTRQPVQKPSRQPLGFPTQQPTRQPNSKPTQQPARNPTIQPSMQPSRAPTKQPTKQPSRKPSMQPFKYPSRRPSMQPSFNPTNQIKIDPTTQPSAQPRWHPTSIPSKQPNRTPSMQPLLKPRNFPTSQPSRLPIARPTKQPQRSPTSQPSKIPIGGAPSSQPKCNPTQQPLSLPTNQPESKPSSQPYHCPTSKPSKQPARRPSMQPITLPSMKPSRQPICHPTTHPTVQPTNQPKRSPSSQPSRQPLHSPTAQPSRNPTKQPSFQPSRQPYRKPSRVPSCQPSRKPTIQPSNQPLRTPSRQPSKQPVRRPSSLPSRIPTRQPSRQPRNVPTTQPYRVPTSQPSIQPFRIPSQQPFRQPSQQPSSQPSQRPSKQPTLQPFAIPTSQPSYQPTRQPTKQPLMHPTCQPTSTPNNRPSQQPKSRPSTQPSKQPRLSPTSYPSSQPRRRPSRQPIHRPTAKPSKQPVFRPSSQPFIIPTDQPSVEPASYPTSTPSNIPSETPTMQPVCHPSKQPIRAPSTQPSRQPIRCPSKQPLKTPSKQPILRPSMQPSNHPSRQPSKQPIKKPSQQPLQEPTKQPITRPTSKPTRYPTRRPINTPTARPTSRPTAVPSHQPVGNPSSQPLKRPSLQPIRKPSVQPTNQPSCQPSFQPTCSPTDMPTRQPKKTPSIQPTKQPRKLPTSQPTGNPIAKPTKQPIKFPSTQPTMNPTRVPSLSPTRQPNNDPTRNPINSPTIQPSKSPSMQPSEQPQQHPISKPTRIPTRQPTGQPMRHPTGQPIRKPTQQPTLQPRKRPTSQPSLQPRRRPTNQPSGSPTSSPFRVPLASPTSQPSLQPRRRPTSQPFKRPTCRPSSHPNRDPSVQPTRSPFQMPSKQPNRCPTRYPTKQPYVLHPSSQPLLRPTVQPRSRPTRVPTCQPNDYPSYQPSSQPYRMPSKQPSRQPIRSPSRQPSRVPSLQPSTQPVRKPTKQPLISPSKVPSKQPILLPSFQPTKVPILIPTSQPTISPSLQPLSTPSRQPSSQPSRTPNKRPTRQPFCSPTKQPSHTPSRQPTRQPFKWPTNQPTKQPNRGAPSDQPTHCPTSQPTGQPDASFPTAQPTNEPTLRPTVTPSRYPTHQPSKCPSLRPSNTPSKTPSRRPTKDPTCQPSIQPSLLPTTEPSIQPTSQPTIQPVVFPSSQPSSIPDSFPSIFPHCRPSRQPIRRPSKQPTRQPFIKRPSSQPSRNPSSQPSKSPRKNPSRQPSKSPIRFPSKQPLCNPTSQPSKAPRNRPTKQPARKPTTQPAVQSPSRQPSRQPIRKPTNQPTYQPRNHPTRNPLYSPSSPPSKQPRMFPSSQPSKQPIVRPSAQPRCFPTIQPSQQPRQFPSQRPSRIPTFAPSSQPFHFPTRQPNELPSSPPSNQPISIPSSTPSIPPSIKPSLQPFKHPSQSPSWQPTRFPTIQPNFCPTSHPSIQPAFYPSIQPKAKPSMRPSHQPSVSPSLQPFFRPSRRPSIQPIYRPTTKPSCQPVHSPTIQPAKFPSGQPTRQPVRYPSLQPFHWPSCHPTNQPIHRPTTQPSQQPNRKPSCQPRAYPSGQPSNQPLRSPTQQPLRVPTWRPSRQPTTQPTSSPTKQPSKQPRSNPTSQPSRQPRSLPTGHPISIPSNQPHDHPSNIPSYQPIGKPSVLPSKWPFSIPTVNPTENPSSNPTILPSKIPSAQPSHQPRRLPSHIPTIQPIRTPSRQPLSRPTLQPQMKPSKQPTLQPFKRPSSQPICRPSRQPSRQPFKKPSRQPSFQPSHQPTMRPTYEPSRIPSCKPTGKPRRKPSGQPSIKPHQKPSNQPFNRPTKQPMSQPSNQPNRRPSTQPSHQPLENPTKLPTFQPTFHPTMQPFHKPTAQPNSKPSDQPSHMPSSKPSGSHPSSQPILYPSKTPSEQPSSQPTKQPSTQPSSTPTSNFGFMELWRAELQRILILESSFPGGYSVPYYAAYQQMNLNQKLEVGSCSQWTAFTSKLNNVNLNIYSAAAISFDVSYSVIPSGKSFRPFIITCSESSKVQSITQNILSLSSRSSAQKLFTPCGNHTWVVSKCVLTTGSFVAVCVDCLDPCETSFQMCYDYNDAAKYHETAVIPFSILPCGDLKFDDTCRNQNQYSSTDAIKVLTVKYTSTKQNSIATTIPHIDNMRMSSDRTAISVSAVLSRTSVGGSLSCGVLPFGSSDPVSLDVISRQGFVSTFLTNEVNVTIGGLVASTSYNVYCFTASLGGLTADLMTMLASKVQYATICCRYIFASLQATHLVTDSNGKDFRNNFLTIQVDTLPCKALSILIQIKSNNISVIEMPKLLPSTIVVDNSTCLSHSFATPSKNKYFSSLYSVLPGSFNISLSLSGYDKDLYTVLFDEVSTKQPNIVIAGGDEFSAPNLISSVFSNDGATIGITFDVDTNRGGTKTIFNCSLLFTFACAATSTCIWIDDRHVTANVFGSAQCVMPLDVLKLSSWSSITNAKNPSSLLIADTQKSVFVAFPIAAVQPQVTITMSNNVGICDDVVIDMSASVGSGGRVWASNTITVQGINYAGYVDKIDLDAYLSSKRNELVIKIPNKLLLIETVYSFTVIMCNFLGSCGSATATTYVVNNVVPQVLINGATRRSHSRNQPVVLTSNVLLSLSCGASNFAASSLMVVDTQYHWNVYFNNAPQIDILSTSIDPATFILPPYSLLSSTTYVIELAVSITLTDKHSTSYSYTASGFADSTLYIPQGHVVAIITGGISRSVTAGNLAIIDASNSYDEDVSIGTGKDAGLLFSWSCVQMYPFYSLSCKGLNIQPMNDTEHLDKLQFKPFLDASLYSFGYRVTVNVWDSLRSRMSSAFVDITVNSPWIPSVELNIISKHQISSGVQIANANELLKLQASVLMINNFTCQWTVNDDSYNLTSLSLTPTRVQLSASTSPMNAYLGLPPNTLHFGTKLMFLLTCEYFSSFDHSLYSAQSSVLIEVNTPPQPGVVVLTPITGTAYSTVFSYSAKYWNDANLPIQYQFYYRTPTFSNMTLQLMSEVSYALFTLPDGDMNNRSKVDLVLQIFDAMHAYTSIHSYPTVFNAKKSENYNTMTNLLQNVSKGLQSNGQKMKVYAAVSQMINYVNTTYSYKLINCTALHRRFDKWFVGSCGDCISNLFVGDSGPSIDKCVSTSQFKRKDAGSRRSLLSFKCVSSSDCEGFEICSSGICVVPLKRCQADCSGRGKCSYIVKDSGIPIADCRVGFSNCTAVCNCQSGYNMSSSCSTSNKDISRRQSIRSTLLNNLWQLMQFSNPTMEALLSWSSFVIEMTTISDELSGDVFNIVIQIISYILENARNLGVSYRQVQTVLRALNQATVAASREQNLQYQRFISSQKLPYVSFLSHIDSTMDVLRKYLELLQIDLLPAQESDTIIYSEFRLQSHVQSSFTILDAREKDVKALDSSFAMSGWVLNLQVPRTSVEVSNNDSFTSAKIPVSELNNMVNSQFSIVSIRSADYMPGYFKSNILNVLLSEKPYCDDNNCSIQIDFSNSILSIAQNATEEETVNTQCFKGFPESHFYRCKATGIMLNITCHGNETNVITTTCPQSYNPSVCTSLLYNEQSSFSMGKSCSLIHDTATTVACSCPLSLVYSQAENNTISVASIYIVDTVPTKTYIASAVSDKSGPNNRYDITICMSTVLLVFLFCLSKNIFFQKKNSKSRRKFSKIYFDEPDDKGSLLLNDLVPIMFQSGKTLSERLRDVCLVHHSWIIPFVCQEMSTRNIPKTVSLEAIIKSTLLLLFNATSVLFFQCILLFAIERPNSCDGIKDMSSCNNFKSSSSLTQHSNICVWNHYTSSPSSKYGECLYRNPSDDPELLLFLALYATLCSFPMMVLVAKLMAQIPIKLNYLDKLLKYPSIQRPNHQLKLKAIDTGGKEILNTDVGRSAFETVFSFAKGDDFSTSESYNKVTDASERHSEVMIDTDLPDNSNDRLSTIESNTSKSAPLSPFSNEIHRINTKGINQFKSIMEEDAFSLMEYRTVVHNICETVDSEAKRQERQRYLYHNCSNSILIDLVHICNDISAYRQSLDTVKRMRFDDYWGLSTSSGYFNFVGHNSWSHKMLKSLHIYDSIFTKDYIYRLQLSHHYTDHLCRNIDLIGCTKKKLNLLKSKILVSFLRDFLPNELHKKAFDLAISRHNNENDSKENQQLTTNQNRMIWSCIAFVFVGIMVGVFVFGSIRRTFFQQAVLISFIIWVVADIVIIQPLILFLKHICMQSILNGSVQTAFKYVQYHFNNNANNYTGNNDDIDDKSRDIYSECKNNDHSEVAFNACKHYFVAHRIIHEMKRVNCPVNDRWIQAVESFTSSIVVYNRNMIDSMHEWWNILPFLTLPMALIWNKIFPQNIRNIVLELTSIVVSFLIILLHIKLYSAMLVYAFLPAIGLISIFFLISFTKYITYAHNDMDSKMFCEESLYENASRKKTKHSIRANQIVSNAVLWFKSLARKCFRHRNRRSTVFVEELMFSNVAITKMSSMASLEEGNYESPRDDYEQEDGDLEVNFEQEELACERVNEKERLNVGYEESVAQFQNSSTLLYSDNTNEVNNYELDLSVSVGEHDITSIEQLDSSVVLLVDECDMNFNVTTEPVTVSLDTDKIDEIDKSKDPEVEAAHLNANLTSPVLADTTFISNNFTLDSQASVIDDDSVSIQKDLDFFVGNKKGKKKGKMKAEKSLEVKKKKTPTSKSNKKPGKRDKTVEVPLLVIPTTAPKQEEIQAVQKLTLSDLFADETIHADVEAAYDMNIDWNSSFDINHW